MIFQQIRQKNPIVHCITNIVSANFQANGLLAVGASPIMSESIDECEEVVSKVQALCLNIGTLNSDTMRLMITAGKAANHFNIPVVLDPVGAGFTQYRTESALQLLQSFQVQAIRCNLGEFAALAGIQWQSKGVDAGTGNLHAVKERIQLFAKKYNCLLAVTGKEDILASQDEILTISGGHHLITEVTASGCLLSAVCGASLAVEGNSFQQLQQTLQSYKEAAWHAFTQSRLLGQFQTEFINRLYQLSLGE
ncbi:hydroxyethylthiazole kinase [Neisseriaceae bacterium PsAf]|nr:hydroxyethylthiazole kinase [Neisseriaceae bacterium PsAf]MCV2503202.1 hydroxyethylthiazole kinase [Neisseriaceae bacterium]